MVIDGYTVTMERDEYIALVNGRYKMCKCTECHSGLWYYTDDCDMPLSPSVGVTSDMYTEPCTYCDGMGFNVSIRG